LLFLIGTENNVERGKLNYIIFTRGFNNNAYRWHNHIDPMVRKCGWNETEEYVFIESHKIHGNKWAEIAKVIPGR
jgi:myb proto-oncogene protein